MVLFLNGCSGIDLAVNTMSEMKPGLIEISRMNDSNLTYISADFYGDNLMIFAADSIADDEYSYYLYLVDYETAEVTDKKQLTEFSMESISGAEYTDDGSIIIYDEYNKKSAVYDSSLHFIEEMDIPLKT